MRDELIALAERVEAFDSDVRNGEALGAEVINAATDGGLPFWEHANPLYSLDAAMGLYIDKPDVISTCPRKVCADALRQRAEVLGKGPEGRAQ